MIISDDLRNNKRHAIIKDLYFILNVTDKKDSSLDFLLRHEIRTVTGNVRDIIMSNTYKQIMENEELRKELISKSNKFFFIYNTLLTHDYTDITNHHDTNPTKAAFINTCCDIGIKINDLFGNKVEFVLHPLIVVRNEVKRALDGIVTDFNKLVGDKTINLQSTPKLTDNIYLFIKVSKSYIENITSIDLETFNSMIENDHDSLNMKEDVLDIFIDIMKHVRIIMDEILFQVEPNHANDDKLLRFASKLDTVMERFIQIKHKLEGFVPEDK